MRHYGAIILVTSALVSGAAFAAKLEHAAIAEPVIVATVDAAALGIGRISSAIVDGDQLVIAASDGVAVIGADGAALWVAKLPHADLRSVAADATGVAVVSQDLKDSTPGALLSFIGGELTKLPDHANTTLHLLDRQNAGAVLWTLPFDTATRATPPALTESRVALGDGKTLLVLNRADGTVGASGKTVNQAGDYIASLGLLSGLEGVVLRGATRTRPLWSKGGFYSTFAATFSKVDGDSGKSVFRHNTFGLFTPFQNITAGPALLGDKIVFANTAQPIPGAMASPKPSVFMGAADGDEEWSESVDDDRSGVGSLAVHKDRIYVATNFVVAAYDAEGDDLWTAENAKKKGAVGYSKYRGVRYKGGWAARTSLGDCLAVDDRFVYVSASEGIGPGSRDLVTVLDAAKGKYVTSIDPKGDVIDLQLIGGNLAVVGFDQVRIIKPPQ